MNHTTPLARYSHQRRHTRGFTLIELMIALVIGLFLLGGLLVMMQNQRRTSGAQTQLAQLQDSERLAMTMITDVIRSAGYFTDQAGASSPTSWLVASAPFAQGQAVSGTTGTSDTIAVRNESASGDGIVNCAGGSNGSGATVTYVNEFSVVGGYLVCTLSTDGVAAAPVQLVGGPTIGVKSLKILYGTNSATTINNVNTYLDASSMTASTWTNVISVRITLEFQNPLYVGGSSDKQPATVKFSRVVTVMNKAGVQT